MNVYVILIAVLVVALLALLVVYLLACAKFREYTEEAEGGLSTLSEERKHWQRCYEAQCKALAEVKEDRARLSEHHDRQGQQYAEKIAEAEAHAQEIGRLRERLVIDPGGSDKIDELESVIRDIPRRKFKMTAAVAPKAKNGKISAYGLDIRLIDEQGRVWNTEVRTLAASKANKEILDNLAQEINEKVKQIVEA